MAYRANPFLERMSERTSDQEFVRLFSPKIIERLAEDAFQGAVHIFRSPPGGGKTTLLRAFTPTALKAFWNTRRVQETNESYQKLVSRQVMHEQDGPQLLGVLLSCASGYADLPPGVSISQEGLFRALLDCRIVLRAIRNLSALMSFGGADQLDSVRLEYDEIGQDFKSIPTNLSAGGLMRWAEQRERSVYAVLDSLGGSDRQGMPTHVRFESVLWLQSVRFIVNNKAVAPRRLLMIDDLHKLRKKQRALLIEELTELRPTIPVWLAERSIALGEELLSQGAREGRDLRQYSLEEIWSAQRGQHQFATFAQNILQRRLDVQTAIPSGAFSQYLRDQFASEELRNEIELGYQTFKERVKRYKENARYSKWLERAENNLATLDIASLSGLYVTTILISRDESKRQMTLELAPLPAEELEDRDSSQLQAAAEIFIHDELKVPYYFGIDKLCTLATNNVEELLALAAALYEGLLAKLILRKPELLLSPSEQEKLVKDVARRKRDFIPKSHTEGTRAQRLLDAIGVYCRERTFLPNAPYSPGVTGVRLSSLEFSKLRANAKSSENRSSILLRVLAECVAENLLVPRESAASTSRDSGTVFYLNRILCAHFDLPLQMGGWQDVSAETMMEWMELGPQPSRKRRLEM